MAKKPFRYLMLVTSQKYMLATATFLQGVPQKVYDKELIKHLRNQRNLSGVAMFKQLSEAEAAAIIEGAKDDDSDDDDLADFDGVEVDTGEETEQEEEEEELDGEETSVELDDTGEVVPPKTRKKRAARKKKKKSGKRKTQTVEA